MITSLLSNRRAVLPAFLAVIGLGFAGLACGGNGDSAPDETPSEASPPQAAPANDAKTLACALTGPEDGVSFGVNLDWENDSIAEYSRRLGKTPAVFVLFAAFPMDESARGYVKDIASQLAQSRSSLVLTLEPMQGLESVTPVAAQALAAYLGEINALGTPVFLRFAHEMNGSWYSWSQTPLEYISAFRKVASAVHADAPGTAMVWAPNYGGGYPFRGGKYTASPGTPAYDLLDTNRDGLVSIQDDPYSPYYPGDDAVDWVGMSLYHWGSAYPWGENETPEPDKFIAQLTGEYRGLAGDETALPDFYADYGVGHGKPVAITETAAFFKPDISPSSSDEIKSSWWSQVFPADLADQYSQIKMINWFEWSKHETEVGAVVDWTVTRDPALLADFQAALPAYLRYAGEECRTP
jgi:hypothetical protein